VSRVDIDELRAALRRRAAGLGFDRGRGARLADHFLDAELRGARGHGAERMRWLYGFDELNPAARPRLEERTDGLARYRADGALGYLALAEALDAELADPPSGARLVVVAECFPTGRLGYFAEAGARAGLLALVTATSTPRIVHPQGGPPLLGTNPLCLALPGDPPTVVDVSMGAVTYGAVLAGRARLEELVPFGGDQAHKAFALAVGLQLLVDALVPADGFGAVLLVARPESDPVPALRALAAGVRLPGDRFRERSS